MKPAERANNFLSSFDLKGTPPHGDHQRRRPVCAGRSKHGTSGSSEAGHQRLQHPGSDRKRLGFPDGQQRPAPQHLPNGRAGQRQESFPLQHRRPAHLVHHPRQQRRLRRAQERNRHPGGDECRDRHEDILSLPSRRRRDLRRAANLKQYRDDVDLLPGALRQAHRGGVSRSQAAQARQEHGLRRRGGAAALAST